MPHDHPLATAASACAYLASECRALSADLRDEHAALAPHPHAKTAGWLLGHLAVSGDFLRSRFGRPSLAPREWRGRFAPGTQVSLVPADYPPMDQLRTICLAVYDDLAIAAPGTTTDQLELPNPVEFARAAFPFVGGFAVHLMTSHFGYHLGQLSGWRVAAGLPARAERPT